jgi:hypothetical protein
MEVSEERVAYICTVEKIRKRRKELIVGNNIINIQNEHENQLGITREGPHCLHRISQCSQVYFYEQKCLTL